MNPERGPANAGGSPTNPAPSPFGRMPSSIDISKPNPARIYDYLLGGTHNFAVDRHTAEAAMTAGRVTALPARANRAFLRRAVRYLIDTGIDQFLDLGSGIPTSGNVHEIARRACPDARVVYVDNEPVAVAHARHLLAGDENTAIIDADLRDTETVLGHPDTRRLLDFRRPIGVLAVAVFHFIPDSDRPADIIRRYLRDAGSGSHLAVSHYTDEDYDQVKRAWAERGKAAYQATGTTAIARGRGELGALLTGLVLVPPGIVWTPEWRPDDNDPAVDRPFEAELYAAVGRIP